jgi:hypothetical protein
MIDETEYPPERQALFEKFVEDTAPPPTFRCTCDLCVYGVRPRLSLRPRKAS